MAILICIGEKQTLPRIKLTKNGNMQECSSSMLDNDIAFKYADMSKLFIYLNNNINIERSERRAKPSQSDD